jgi:type I restriction enzyme M protein
MNMILHDFPTANILSGNTLANPKFNDGPNLRAYDYVVANPPFSVKTWSTGVNIEADSYQRFGWGVPPAKQGDYAFLLHIIRSLKSTGKGACILPHGVLFRGNAEAVIRSNLVRSGYLKGVIGLPANLFYGTGIPACILVLDKENATARKGIFMIDASKGFRKDGPKNRLREQDIHRIVDTFARQVEIPGYARMVPLAEISDPRNDFNLNLPRYIDSTEPEDLQDITAHLRGGNCTRLSGVATQSYERSYGDRQSVCSICAARRCRSWSATDTYRTRNSLYSGSLAKPSSTHPPDDPDTDPIA